MHELRIICDRSGSMSDNGLPFIMRNAVRTIDQYIRLYHKDVAIKLVLWNDSINTFEWHLGQDVPDEVLVCEGKSSSGALTDAFNGADDNPLFLLLTDGYWGANSRKTLSTIMKQLPPESLRIVKLGSDAETRLGGPSVYSGEELVPLMDSWLV